jgi:hypothetical protein
VGPMNNRSAVRADASGTIRPGGTNNGMRRLSQNEATNCQHDGQYCAFHFRILRPGCCVNLAGMTPCRVRAMSLRVNVAIFL